MEDPRQHTQYEALGGGQATTTPTSYAKLKVAWQRHHQALPHRLCAQTNHASQQSLQH
jgi:superoxide dismutase